MNSKDDPRGILKKGIPSSTNEISSLKQQMVEMQLEIDILKETINVLKKDPGVSKAPLKNNLRKLEMPKSSYYYQKARSDRIDKYQELRKSINAAYYDNRACYGYRRIHAVLKKNGFVDCQVKLTHFYV